MNIDEIFNKLMNGTATRSEITQMFAVLANDSLPNLRGAGISEVKQFVDDKNIVAGVWNTENAASPIGCAIIKGEDLFNTLAHNSKPTEFKLAALPCRSAREAEALCLAIGDLAPDHNLN